MLKLVEVLYIMRLILKSILLWKYLMNDVPEWQKPIRITSDLGSEFNSKEFQENKTAIVDRLIRTIKDKLECYRKLNDSQSIIQIVKDIIKGYNLTLPSENMITFEWRDMKFIDSFKFMSSSLGKIAESLTNKQKKVMIEHYKRNGITDKNIFPYLWVDDFKSSPLQVCQNLSNLIQTKTINMLKKH